MTDLKCIDRSCMRLRAIKKHETRRQRKSQAVGLSTKAKNIAKIQEDTQISEWLFENCIDCGRMSAIPQGAFAACKVRDNLQRGVPISDMDKQERPVKENVYNPRQLLEGWELTPLKYNSKLMNSIWGLYNRYSVHNFKKNTDAEEGVGGVFAAGWAAVEDRIPAARAASAVAAAAASANTTRIMPGGNSLSSSL